MACGRWMRPCSCCALGPSSLVVLIPFVVLVVAALCSYVTSDMQLECGTSEHATFSALAWVRSMQRDSCFSVRGCPHPTPVRGFPGPVGFGVVGLPFRKFFAAVSVPQPPP